MPFKKLHRNRFHQHEERLKVMVIDDEASNLSVFRALFRKTYDIICFQDAEEALEFRGIDEIDIVISDQTMPKMSGLELINLIRSKNPNITSIILTGFMDNKLMHYALNECGIDHVIHKPFNREEILEKTISYKKSA